MPRGPVEVHIQAISAAYRYIYGKEQRIKSFCERLRRTAAGNKRMIWYPETNELHHDALEALDNVAAELTKIRKEVESTSNDYEFVKTESLKRMDNYLVCHPAQNCCSTSVTDWPACQNDKLEKSLVDKLNQAFNSRQRHYPEVSICFAALFGFPGTDETTKQDSTASGKSLKHCIPVFIDIRLLTLPSLTCSLSSQTQSQD